MIGIASGILRGQQDTFEPDRVARGNIDAIQQAGLPKYGNVFNFDYYREQRDLTDQAKHVAALLRDF